MSNYNKLLSDILRCEEFLERYINGVPYKDCLISTQTEHLVNIKSSYIYSLEEAKHIAKTTVDRVKAIKEKYMDTHEVMINKNVEDMMNRILTDVIKASLREELLHE